LAVSKTTMSRYRSSYYQRQSSPGDFDDDDDSGDDDNSDYDDEDDEEEVREKYIPRKRSSPAKIENIYKPKKKFKPGNKDASISGIYVLENGRNAAPRFYVGKSNNVAQRVRAHMSGQGGVGYLSGQHLRKVALISNGSLNDLESWERNETLERMYRFGIDNVRGWMFTDLELSDDQYETAFNQICEKFDLCRRCGRNSHFRGNCFARSTAEWSGSMDL